MSFRCPPSGCAWGSGTCAVIGRAVSGLVPQVTIGAISQASKCSSRSKGDEVRDAIRKLKIFNSLNYEELKSIRDWTEVITVGPGDFVLKQAQQGEHMYVILEGNVEVFILDDDGKIVVLASLNDGEYFGEHALMPDSKGKRNAYARADKEARLVKIPKDYFRLMLKRDSKLAESLKKSKADQDIQRKNV